MVKHAKFIPQSWENEETFSMIREHYAPHFDLTYVYTSNTVGFLWRSGEPDKAKQVLDNIESLNLDIAFHTNMPLPTIWVIARKHEHSPEYLMRLIECSNELVAYNGIANF